MDPQESAIVSKDQVFDFLFEINQQNPGLVPNLLAQNNVSEEDWAGFLSKRTECIQKIFEHQGSASLVSIDAIRLMEEGKEEEAYKAQESFLEDQRITSSATLPYFGLIMELVDGNTTPCHTQMPIGPGRETPILLLSPDLGAVRFMANNIKEANVQRLHIVQFEVKALNRIDSIEPSRIITNLGGFAL